MKMPEPRIKLMVRANVLIKLPTEEVSFLGPGAGLGACRQ